MTSKSVTVAEYVAYFLAKELCPAVFQVSGGMIAFLTDSIEQLGNTILVHNRHEQGSGFAAEGATRVSGKPAVAMATSGPGATNLITPIASCFFDSIPTVFITGQVRIDELRKDKNQRQNGFQELDIETIVGPLTKQAWMVKEASEVKSILRTAWELCQSGRPGPVLIDIPIDIQQQLITLEDEEIRESDFNATKISEQEVKNLGFMISALEKAKRPIVMVGGGVRTANAVEDVQEFLKNSNIPYVATLLGLDSVNQTNENYLGFIGSYGNRWANEALEKADVLLVLGSRLDVRQTGPDIQKFVGQKIIIRIDVDCNELGGRVPSDISVNIPLQSAMKELLRSKLVCSSNSVVSESLSNKLKYPQANEQEFELELNPNDVLLQISRKFRESNGYVVDVGQHQMWAAQSLKIERHQRFLTSGGLGSMGFAIPASIGASFAENGRWVAIVGDGCLQLSIQELQTISHYQLPISIILMNNSQHGMVAQFQEENMQARFTGTRDGYSNPDYQHLSEAFRFQRYTKIETQRQLSEYVEATSSSLEGPELVEIVIDFRAKALPKMKFKA